MHLLRNLIDWKIYKKDYMTGAKVTFFQLFRFTLLRYFNGPSFMGNPTRMIFNYEFGFGIVSRNFMEMISPLKITIDYCRTCGPFVKGYSEVWNKGESDPFEVRIFQYKGGNKEIVETIELKPNNKTSEIIIMDYCGKCNDVIMKDVVPASRFKGNQIKAKGSNS